MLGNINPDLRPSVGRYIESGADSTVFQFGSNAVKIYKDHITLDQIALYEHLTNRMARYVDRVPQVGQVFYRDQSVRYHISINPILEAGLCSRFLDRITVVAPYIFGPQMADFYHGVVMTNDLIRIKQELELVGNKKERKFLETLLKDGQRNDQSLVNLLRNELRKTFQRLSLLFGVSGLDPNAPNAKLRFCTQTNSLNLVVTDLCSGIRELK